MKARKLACLARGKRYLSKGISRENLDAAKAPIKEVVSRNYQLCFLLIFRPNLNTSIK
jgi:hypothetical protein